MSNRVIAPQYTGFLLTQVGTTNITPYTGLSGATMAYLTFEGSAVRYRPDGVSAHSATGHLTLGTPITLEGANVLQNFNVICPTVTGTIMASIGYT